MCLRDTTLHDMTFATRCLDHGLVTRGYYSNVERFGAAAARIACHGIPR